MTIPPPPPAPWPFGNDAPPTEYPTTAGTMAPKLATTTDGTVVPEYTAAELKRLDELTIAWHDASGGIAKYEQIRTEAAEAILGLLPPGATHMVPGTGVGVTVRRPSGRFDAATAAATLGPDAEPALVRTYDNAVLKALLKARGLGDGMAPGTGRPSVVAAK